MKHTGSKKPPMKGAIVQQIKELTKQRNKAALLLGQCDAAITALHRLEAKEGRGPYA